MFLLTECVDPTELVGILQCIRDVEQAASTNTKAEVVKFKTMFSILGADVATLKR
jgi:hypothetical protein